MDEESLREAVPTLALRGRGVPIVEALAQLFLAPPEEPRYPLRNEHDTLAVHYALHASFAALLKVAKFLKLGVADLDSTLYRSVVCFFSSR
jgi:hypothetical protein